MSSLKRYLLGLNLFESSSDNNQQENDEHRRFNIIATRFYLVFLILILIAIGLVLSLISQTIMITIKHPTKQQFELLPTDATCFCSRISPSYGTFASLETSFHEVCSSDFVTDQWLDAISSGINSSYFIIRDFRMYGSAQFQSLAAFCRLSKVNIDESIAFFYLDTFFSPQVLSENVLRSQTGALIDQFQLTAPNTFKSQLRLINQMTVNNRLTSGLLTNGFFTYSRYFNVESYHVKTIIYLQEDGARCSCNVDICSKGQSGIYTAIDASNPVSASTVKWLLVGISAGCLPVTSMLVSTLECFYNQTCVDKLISYFPTNDTFQALIVTNESLYYPNSTVQSMIDNLMIEDWIINISYENYYSECAPSSCTYFKVSSHSFMFVLTKLISLLAGITVTLKLIISFVIRILQYLRKPRPRLSRK